MDVTKQLITTGLVISDLPEPMQLGYLNATSVTTIEPLMKNWDIQFTCFLPTTDEGAFSVRDTSLPELSLIPSRVYLLICNLPLVENPVMYSLWHLRFTETLDVGYNMLEVMITFNNGLGETLRGARTVSKTFIRPDEDGD